MSSVLPKCPPQPRGKFSLLPFIDESKKENGHERPYSSVNRSAVYGSPHAAGLILQGCPYLTQLPPVEAASWV